MKTGRKTWSRTIIFIILVIVAISNTPPMQYFLLEQYTYRNKDGSFKYKELHGGMDFTVGELNWEHFLSENPTNPNRTLYRTFTIKPWQFWEWWQYIAHSKRFSLPYLENN